MKYLVLCTCGHAIDRHGWEGCRPDERLPCRCRNDEASALEAAVEQARCNPLEAAASGEGSNVAQIPLALHGTRPDASKQAGCSHTSRSARS